MTELIGHAMQSLHPLYPSLTRGEVTKVRRIVSKGLVGRSLSWQAICARPALAAQVLAELGGAR